MRPNALGTLQRRFWRLVSAPEGVEAAARVLAKEDPGALPLDRWIAGSDPQASAFRINIYAQMYLWRLLDVLRDDFPKVLSVLGEEAFGKVIRDYLSGNPSIDPSVRHVGSRLPAFLKGHALTGSYPYLASLAELEWARSLCFDRADAEPLRLDSLGSLKPDEWPHACFEVISSHALLRLEYPVHEIWMAVEKGDPLPKTEKGPQCILVWREGFTVYHRAVSEPDARAFGLLSQGKPFAEICEPLSEGLDVAEAAEKAMTTLVQWVRDGLVAGYGVGKKKLATDEHG